MPVNVIMPPASAPKIVCAADVVIGRLLLVADAARRAAGRPIASATATTFAASTGSHIAELSRIRSRNRRLVAPSSWCA